LDRFSFVWLRAIESVGLGLGFNRLSRRLEQFVQVGSFEQSVAVDGIAMHWKIATGCPITDRVVVDTEVLGSFCGMQVFRQFGHGFGLDLLDAMFTKTTA
jgi:hypothetical protein